MKKEPERNLPLQDESIQEIKEMLVKQRKELDQLKRIIELKKEEEELKELKDLSPGSTPSFFLEDTDWDAKIPSETGNTDSTKENQLERTYRLPTSRFPAQA